MKVSAALSLVLAPLALAKAVQNVYPVHRRSPHKAHLAARDGHLEKSKAVEPAGAGKNTVKGLSPAELALLGLSGVGITETAVRQVIIIWVNGGGGAATTAINSPVTTTVTVGGGAAAAPTEGAKTESAAAGGEAPPATSAGGAAPPATSVAGGAAATHTVTVGGPAAGLTFSPPEIKAAIGDMVIFTFLSANHTATQSAFATPCEPLAGGMDSGFQPNPNNTVNPPPQVAMQVMVDTPLWFFCKQANHCGKGMTFSINPTAAKTQAMFQAAAIAQKGSGAGTAITGGTPPPPPAEAAPAAGSSAAAPPAATEAAPSATAPTGAGGAAATGGAAPPAGIAVGTGQLNTDGSCACAVVCQVGAFPAVAQGSGAFGGLSGAIPNNMITV